MLIANPCTPVRFRYPPPELTIDLKIIIIHVIKALRVYLGVYPRVYLRVYHDKKLS